MSAMNEYIFIAADRNFGQKNSKTRPKNNFFFFQTAVSKGFKFEESELVTLCLHYIENSGQFT